jgi:type I restriction enzyme S subunit
VSFPRYPKYKRSGVEWLGDLPEHWGVTQLKRVVDNQRQITYGIVQAGPHVPDGIPYIRPADMTDEHGVLRQVDIMRTAPDIAAAYSRSTIRAGDLVVSIGPSFGKVMIIPTTLHGANLTQGTARIAVQPPYNARYLFWTLRSPASVAQWESSVGGATFRALNLAPLAQTMVPVPDETEQAVIALFLDGETSKIDALVMEQQRLIDLLNEKRQAVISRAVTKGLNPHAQMKPSGIEWIGQVPKHWDVTRLKWICSEINDINHEMPTAVESGVPFLSAKDLLDDGTLNFTNDIKMISEEDFAALSRKMCPIRGDIIYSRIGACLGKARLVETDERFLISYSCCVVRVATTFACSRFIRHLIGRFPVPLPPMQEQTQIATFLEDETGKLRELTAEAERAIVLLQERRTALISAAVTGKIDVRGLVETEAA